MDALQSFAYRAPLLVALLLLLAPFSVSLKPSISTWGFNPKRKDKPGQDSAASGNPYAQGATGQGQAPPSQGSPKKRRNLSDLTVPTAPQEAKDTRAKKPNNAPIVLSVYKFSNDASDVVAGFPAGVPLWSVILQHDAYPSVDSDLLGGLNAFLQELHAGNAGMPENLRVLRADEHTIVTVTNTNPRRVAANEEVNPQQQPWVNYRCVFYIAGDAARLQQILALLHDFFVHRATHPRQCDRSPWPPVDTLTVDVHPHTGVVIAPLDADFQRIAATLHAQSADLPCSVFSVAPPTGVLRLEVEIEVVDDATVVVGFDGRTWGYRERLNMAGVPRVEDNLRVVPDEHRNVSVEASSDFILSLFRGRVFRELVCTLTWTGVDVNPQTPVAELQTLLRAMPFVFEEAAR